MKLIFDDPTFSLQLLRAIFDWVDETLKIYNT
jgi:hypothetical protein